MKFIKSVMGKTIIVIILQCILTYTGYVLFEQVDNLIKVVVLMSLNWLIVVAFFGETFKSYYQSIENIKELEAKNRLTNLMYALLKEIAEKEDEKDIYDKILEAAIKAVPKSNYGSILLNKDGKMHFVTSYGFIHEYLELVEFEVEETSLYVLTDGKMDKPVIINNLLKDVNNALDDERLDLLIKAGIQKTRSSLTVPIFNRGNLEGIVNLDAEVVNAFDENDIKILDMFALETAKFTQIHKLLEINRYMSKHDELTGIYNRSHTSDIINEKIKNKEKFTLASIDLNNLKKTNDTYGHAVGDLMIRNFIKRIGLFMDKEVIMSRFGGDEFVFVFSNHPKTYVQIMLEDSKAYFKNNPIRAKGEDLYTSFSYGLVAYPEEAAEYSNLLKIADVRMYVDKRKQKRELADMEKEVSRMDEQSIRH